MNIKIWVWIYFSKLQSAPLRRSCVSVTDSGNRLSYWLWHTLLFIALESKEKKNVLYTYVLLYNSYVWEEAKAVSVYLVKLALFFFFISFLFFYVNVSFNVFSVCVYTPTHKPTLRCQDRLWCGASVNRARSSSIALCGKWIDSLILCLS